MQVRDKPKTARIKITETQREIRKIEAINGLVRKRKLYGEKTQIQVKQNRKK